MSGVDDRVVSIEFDNSRFESRLGETIKSLDQLNSTLKLSGASQGLDNVAAAANRFDTSRMAAAVENISSKFSALGAIGFTVLQKLTGGVLEFAKSGLDKVLDPIIEGGKQRAENIQQAKFMFEGLGIDVNKAMDSAKQAVLGTAYGLDAAAKVAAQFGASGIQAGDQMTGALRGVAGAAAMTGSSFQEIGDIFAQSAASGKVRTIDLEQFSTRGLNAAAAIAPILHKTEQQVRDMASNGTLDFKTFADAMDKAFGKHATEANKTFTGSVANLHAAMARLGEAFISPQLNNLRDIFNAISPAIDKVTKALAPVIDTVIKLGAARAGSIVKFINDIDFSKLVKPMKDFADGLANLSADVHAFLAPIHAAFREIFPPDFFGLVARIAAGFKDLTSHLLIGAKTADEIKRTFAGVFAVFSIVGTVVKELAKFIFGLVESLHPAGGGILALSASAGDFLVKMQQILVKGGAIHDFFRALNEAIASIPAYIDLAVRKIKEFFGVDLNKNDVKGTLDGVSVGLGRVSQRADELENVWKRLEARFQGVGNVLGKVWDYIRTWFSELGKNIANAFKPGDFDAAVDIVNTGLLGGIALLLKRFLSGDLLGKLAPGLMKQISGMFGELTNTLKSMQQQIKADTLLKIAEAIGIIAISLVALSLIDSAKLSKALLALTISFGELIGSLTAMDKLVGSNASAVKLGIIGAALIEFASAALILTGAVALMGQLSWDQLTKGLTGVAIGLGLLVAAAKILSDSGPMIVLAGIAMTAMATGLAIMGGAVAIFAQLSLGDLAKGLGAVAIGLGIMVAAIKILDTGPLGGAGAVLVGAGMILMATSLSVLAGAVKLFSTMSVGDLAKGLIAIGAGLVIIAGAMQLMPLSLPITAAGMLILSIALNGLAAAVALMGHLDIATLAKGIGAFAVMLAVLAIGVNAMSGALPGAAALIIVSAAMAILADVLEKLGKLSIAQIATGIGAMAAVIIVLAGLSVALSEAIGPMIAMGVALVVIGAGFTLFGAGVYLLAKGLEALATSGAAGAEALVKIMGILAKGLITTVTKEFEDILNMVPLLIRLIDAILSQLLDTIIKLAPKLGKALVVLFTEGLKALREIYPQLIQTGIDLLLALLNGIANNIDKVIAAAVNIVVNLAQALVDNIPIFVDAVGQIINAFLQGIASYTLQIIDAGVNMLITFLSGITQEVQKIIDAATLILITILETIANDVQQVIDAGTNILVQLLLGITNNIQKIIDTVTFIIITIITQLAANAILIANAGTDALVAFLNALTGDAKKIIDAIGTLISTIITEIGKNANKLVNAGSDALIHFLDGLGSKIPKIIDTAFTVIDNIMQEIGRQVPKFVDAGFRMMIALLDGIADAIRKNAKRMGEAMANLAEAMVEGFGIALKAALKKFVNDEFPSAIAAVINKGLDLLGVSSPSKVFMHIGDMVAEGFAIGITDNFHKPVNALEDGAGTLIESMKKTVGDISNSLGDLGEFNPTITPVLDLTQVQLEATKIDGLMKVSAIVPTTSIDNANLISTATADNKLVAVTSDQNTPQDIKFEQNNYSPTALSVNDIYRQTKSQIALAKEELNIK